MENFIVSARKYRPTTFESVVGQESITQTLRNAIKNNHLAQALLFCGPRGVGKTTCARILAKAINMSDRDVDVSLGNNDEDFAFNIFELDAASNNSVEDIRSLIDQVRFPPQVGKFKVYIIDEVHMLSQAAFNAFLKTLEEPPKHAIFILATTEKHKIIPTILSRCQVFDFNRIQIEDIASHLANIAEKEGITAEPDALHIIAQKADGALRDALSMFDQIVSYSGNTLTYKATIDNLNILDYDYYFRVTDAVLEGNIPQALLIFNEILMHGFDGHNFIVGLEQHFRNLLVCKDPSTLQLLEAGATIRERYASQAGQCSPEFLIESLNICNQCDVEYRNSKNQRLLVELSLMRLSSLVRTEGYAALAKKKATPIAPPDPAHKPSAVIPSAPRPQPAPVPPTPEKKVEEAAPAAATPVLQQEESHELRETPEPSLDAIEHNTQQPASPENITTEVKEETVEPVAEEKPVPQQEESQPPLFDAPPVVSEYSESAPPKPAVAETPKEKEKETPVPLRNNQLQGKFRSSFSINSYVEEKEEKYETAAATDQSGLPHDPYTPEKFIALWKQMAADAEREGNFTLYSILNKEPILKENNLVELVLDNKAQTEEFDVEKTNIQERLRTSLNNFNIQIETSINKDETKKKAYTAAEKFNKMAEKNPHLNSLKDQLGLEINL